VSPVPLGSKGTHDPRVEWLVATAKRGVEAQPILGVPTKPRMGNGLPHIVYSRGRVDGFSKNKFYRIR